MTTYQLFGKCETARWAAFISRLRFTLSAKRIGIILIELLIFSTSALAQTFDSTFRDELQWRSIGPYRGGLVRAVSGVPSQPNVFYMAPVDGGIWKSDDYGRTWQPIFDREPTGSVGAIAVSPSNPDIIYAGSGESTHRPNLSVGDGIYKSVDAGKTWTHLGLRDGQQILKIALDPQNPDRLFVAVMGHPFGPNEERGIFRSTDGGQTFQKVLYKDENTGGSDVAIDPSQPNTVYASMWEAYANSGWGHTGNLFKSIDGGTTWKKLSRGLPGDGDSLIQVNIAIAESNPQVIYITTYAKGYKMGIYRSDAAGDNWRPCTDDPRPAKRIGEGGELPGIAVDPKHANIVYTASIVMWQSTDSGKTWTGIRGAPGGDDYQNIWINPRNPDIFLVGSDQGAIVSVNSGRTWSSWYNQPTGQIYHLSSDNAFPYNVYGGQQDCGSVGIASRGNDGEITTREWHPAGLWESSYVVPDPLNPNIIYSDKNYQGFKLLKYDKRTGQAQDVAPPFSSSEKYRFGETPIVFSPADHKTLYLGANVLFKTADGGNHWTIISPDLTRKSYHTESTIPVFARMNKAPRLGSINTIAPSPLDIRTVWVGTNEGLIQVTHDGGSTWTDVTPPSVSSWNRVSLMDAGHFDVHSAYAAVNCMWLDDRHPHIYRTHDGGKTWKDIVSGLPDDPVNVVREDPVKKGLLFAGTETAVYVSFDDGDHWQPLRLNMPATSNRDLTINGTDLVTATHGRSFWILDNIEPLRQLSGGLVTEDAVLYKPASVFRVRWNVNGDTPLPPDEPAGQNPPDGAIIDYYLKSDVPGEIKMEISDATGRVVRRYSSKDTLYYVPPQNIPLYWIRPQELLSTKAGFHRFTWDLHYTPLNIPPDYPISAVYQNTAPTPTGPWVLPGVYTMKLSVNGKEFQQKLTVKMDPRVLTPAADLQKQFDLSMKCYEGRRQILQAENEFANHPDKQKALSDLKSSLSDLFDRLQSSDKPPTSQMVAQVEDATRSLKQEIAKWKDSKSN